MQEIFAKLFDPKIFFVGKTFDQKENIKRLVDDVDI